MTCVEFKKGLPDVALGLPPEPALRRHLDTCGACRSALEELRQRLGRLDGMVQQSLADEVPPGFETRLALRVQERAVERPGWARLLTASVRVPVLALAGAGVALVLAGALLLRPEPPPPPVANGPSLALTQTDLKGFRPVAKMTLRARAREENQ